MDDLTTRLEKHTAGPQAIGFDYQFYYFMFLVLELRQGQKIGFEVKDDVHIDKEDGTTILLQAKHSILNSNGVTPNLTTLDSDMWKSLSNWSTFIKVDQTKSDFLNKHSFILVTNKTKSVNDFVDALYQFKTDNNIDSAIGKLLEFENKTQDETLKGYIKNVLSLRKKNLKQFFERLKIETSVDEITKKIKNRILEKCLQDKFIEPVFEKLYSNLQEAKYIDIKDRKKFEITFDDFKNKFGKCFQIAFEEKPLPKRDFPILLPEDLESQTFIKQLLDIGEILSGSSNIKKYTTQMLKALNHFTYWVDENYVLPVDMDEFKKNSIQIWENEFRAKYRKIEQKTASGISIEDLESEIKNLGIELVDHLRRHDLSIPGYPSFGIEFSNGHYYALSDNLHIGWHFNWVKKYSK